MFAGNAPNLLTIMAVGMMLLLFGLIAVTAEPVCVAIAAALLIGLALLARLQGLPFPIVFYGLLGYLAWLARRAGKRPA